AARFAGSASQRPIGDDAIARPARGYVGTDPGDFAGGFDANDEWQCALGKGHAAPAPDINMVESDRFDADLNFAAAGLRRCRNIAKLDLAIGNQRERAHRSAGCCRGTTGRVSDNGFGSSAHAGYRVITRHTFWPPKPKELEMVRVTRASRATFGTTSSGMAGSGTWWLIVGGMR